MTGRDVPTHQASQAAVNRFVDLGLTEAELHTLIARLCGSHPEAVERGLDETETDRAAGR